MRDKTKTDYRSLRSSRPPGVLPAERVVVVRRVGDSATITLPKEALALLRWEIGDQVALLIVGSSENAKLTVRRLG